ncbi:MAG: hypothetical protein J6A79_16870 [Clostridia bacterium]|nr:hypothetical protein [Clostridia bacterium]
MDRENFDAIIDRYLDKFDYTNGQGPEEYFKWEAVDCFRSFSPDAEDLKSAFKEAIAKNSVLLDGHYSSPTTGIRALLGEKDEVDFVREAFRRLFVPQADWGKLDLQVEQFVLDVNARIKKHWPNDKSKLQTTRSALCYLALHDPSHNFFYMYSKAANWANYTEYGFDIGSGASFSLPNYYRMCEELVSEIKAAPRLQRCNEARLKKAGVKFEDDYHTLAYDILYCATTYDLYVDLPTYRPGGVQNRILRANERTELNRLLQAAVEAEQALAAFETTGLLPLDLAGQEVKHFLFGTGTILSLEGYKLTVRFGEQEKALVYPDVLGKQLKLASPDIMERLTENEQAKAKLAELEKTAKTARAKYNKKKAAFDRKWVKGIHNEDIVQDEE